jgi:type II secretory pathway component PulM
MEAIAVTAIVTGIIIGGGIIIALMMLAMVINRTARQSERQAAKDLEAQRAIAAELTRLRRMLNPSDESGGRATVHIGGRVVTGRP